MYLNLNKEEIAHPLQPSPTSLLRLSTPQLSKKFLSLLGKNYNKALHREKAFHLKTSLHPKHRLLYKRLLDPSVSTTCFRHLKASSSKAIKQNPVVRFVNHNKLDRNSSLIALKIKNRCKEGKKKTFKRIKGKAPVKTRSLFFLSKGRRQGVSQDKILECLLPHTVRKKATKTNCRIEFKLSKPIKHTEKIKTELSKKEEIRKEEFDGSKKVVSFCDFYFKKKKKRKAVKAGFLVPLELPRVNKEGSLESLDCVFDNTNGFVSKCKSRPNINIKNNMKEKRNNKIKRRKKRGNLEGNFNGMDFYNSRDFFNKAKTSKNDSMGNKRVFNNNSSKKIIARKLKNLNNRKSVSKRKFLKKYNMRLNQSLEKELEEDLVIYQDGFNKTVWMRIVERLLNIGKINKNILVGYYNHYRIFIEEKKKEDKFQLLKNFINKLKKDMEDEKKFDFNFRNYDDFLVN